MMHQQRVRFTSILIAIYSSLIPLENIWAASFGGSITKYVGLLIMAILSIYVVKVSGLIIYVGPMRTLLLWGLYSILTISTSLWTSYQVSSSNIVILINMLVFTVLLLQYSISNKELEITKLAIIFVGSFLSLIIISGNQMVAVNSISGGRATLVIGGLAADNNNLAVSLCIPIMCCFAYAYETKTLLWQKVPFYGLFGIMVIALFLTGSRGGLLALIAGMSVYLVKANGGLRIRTVLLGAGIIIAASFFIQDYLSADLASRFTIRSVIDSGGTGRIGIWKRAINVYANSSIFRMLFGYGIGAFPGVLDYYSGLYAASHNDFIGTLIELGLLGLVLFIILWRKMIKYALKKEKYAELGILIAILIGSLSMEMTIKKMFWLAVYFVFVNVIDNEKENK